jgi:hypothetical protein
MVNKPGIQKMIIANSQSHTFDSFPVLQALMELLGHYRNIKDQVIANKELNILVTEHCGVQECKYRFAGARLEADANPTHPDSITTGLRLTFLMKYDGADGYEQIQMFNVTVDVCGNLKGVLA